jgi:hypothetical protein
MSKRIAAWLRATAYGLAPVPQSVMANCYIEQRPGDPILFDFMPSGLCIVTMHGYRVMPEEAYRGALGREYSRGLNDARGGT